VRLAVPLDQQEPLDRDDREVSAVDHQETSFQQAR